MPLEKDKKIALIGPLANDRYHIIGNWIGMGDREKDPITVFEGLRNAIDNANLIQYEKGCEINTTSKSGFTKAIEAAKKADVVILVMGEAEDMGGEASSRTNLNLPGVQKELLQEVKNSVSAFKEFFLVYTNLISF